MANKKVHNKKPFLKLLTLILSITVLSFIIRAFLPSSNYIPASPLPEDVIDDLPISTPTQSVTVITVASTPFDIRDYKGYWKSEIGQTISFNSKLVYNPTTVDSNILKTIERPPPNTIILREELSSFNLKKDQNIIISVLDITDKTSDIIVRYPADQIFEISNEDAYYKNPTYWTFNMKYKDGHYFGESIDEISYKKMFFSTPVLIKSVVKLRLTPLPDQL